MTIRHARVLIDWNNIQARVDEHFHRNPRANIPPLMLRIQQQIAQVLTRLDATVRHRASLRLYYGWHSRRDATPTRLDFERYRFDLSLARRISNVSFSAGFEFGNELCCYDDPVPIFDTYRGKGQSKGQKMVDTAITCDALHLGRFFPDVTTIIVSDDDDFLPAIITAKRWRARSLLVRVEIRDLSLVTDESLEDEVFYWSEE